MNDHPAARTLPASELHACLSDPVLSAMTFLNEVTTRFPNAISFAPGRPYEALFDTDRIPDYLDAYSDHLKQHLGYTADQVRGALFQYGRTNGMIGELVARTIANDEGVHVSPESIVVTVGAQEGMLLAVRALFARPTDVLLVSSPCYVGITGVARLLDVDVVEVPEGPAGPDPERIAEAAAAVRASGRRPRALYVVPDFGNPSGTSMTVPARTRLLDVARDEDFLVLEDNPYGFFARDDRSLPTLKSLDTERGVLYLGSFAKTCFPGARLGYLVADQEVVRADGSTTALAEELAKLKSMTTVNTSSLSQAVIGGLLVRSGCSLRAANANTIAFYRTNLDLMLAELDRQLPEPERTDLGISWNTPAGGFFVVLTVPFAADEAALVRSAHEFGVLWTPMSSFYLGDGGTTALRLSCSYVEPEQIVAGVGRLAEFLRAQGR